MIIARARVFVVKRRKSKYYYLYVDYIPELESLENKYVLLIILDDKTVPMYLTTPPGSAGRRPLNIQLKHRQVEPDPNVQSPNLINEPKAKAPETVTVNASM